MVGEALCVDFAVSQPNDWQHSAGLQMAALPHAALKPVGFSMADGPGPQKQPPPALFEQLAQTQSSPAYAARQHTQPSTGQPLQLWPALGSMLANHCQAASPEQLAQAAPGPPRRDGQPQHTQQPQQPPVKLQQTSGQLAVVGHRPVSGDQQSSVKCEAAAGVGDCPATPARSCSWVSGLKAMARLRSACCHHLAQLHWAPRLP